MNANTPNHTLTKIRTKSPTSPARPARSVRRLALLAGFGVASLAGPALATIVNVGALAVKITPPPATVEPGAFEGPNVHTFDERQDVTLMMPLPFDARPGTWVRTPDDLRPGFIPAGTCVRSHYLHHDPVLVGAVTGRARFDSEIIGVALLPASLDATNVLGAPGTTYPPNAGAGACFGAGVQCGVELPGDTVRIGNNEIEVNFDALDPGDRVRVITKGTCGGPTCGSDPNHPCER